MKKALAPLAETLRKEYAEAREKRDEYAEQANKFFEQYLTEVEDNDLREEFYGHYKNCDTCKHLYSRIMGAIDNVALARGIEPEDYKEEEEW